MKTVGGFLTNTTIDDLCQKISVRGFTAVRNERGDILREVEFERCRVWAKILPLTAKISDTTPERSNKITYRVTIRRREDIQPDDEIIWRGRRLKLLSPPFDEESRKIFTVFDCEEVVEDGAT